MMDSTRSWKQQATKSFFQLVQCKTPFGYDSFILNPNKYQARVTHRTLLILSYFRDERKSYIKQKYEEKLYVRGYAADQHEIFADLEAAIGAHSLFDLLQVFGEMSSHGIELTDPLPTSVRNYLLN